MMSNIICMLIVFVLMLGLVLFFLIVFVKDLVVKSLLIISVYLVIYVDCYDFNELVIDSWIIIKVKVDLLISSNVLGIEIKVEMVNGVVSLSGIVVIQVEKDKVVIIVKGIKGVICVDVVVLKVSVVVKC